MPRPLGTATAGPEPGGERSARSGRESASRPLPLPLSRQEHDRLVSILRERSRPVDILPPPDLPEPFAALAGRPLPRRPRALILDVYGTLVSSGAGEVGSAVSAAGPGAEADGTGAPGGPGVAESAAAAESGMTALGKVLAEYGLRDGPAEFEARLAEEIRREHRSARESGVPWPEVDGAALLARRTGLSLPDARRFGAAREAVLNPAVPMPGAEALLKIARRYGLVLGLVSNAQYYTEPALEAAFGRNLDALGFDPELRVWSWRLGRAKPDPELFRIMARALESRGIRPGDAVYIGNDLLNDIAPARSCGFRTALFAGDARSLRLRAGDPRVEGVLPDTVLASFHGAAAVFRLGGRDPVRCIPGGPAKNLG